MRLKLLSLHLLLTVLNSHMTFIVDPTAIIYSTSSHKEMTFIQAIDQYLYLCLSRNVVSPVPRVFEVTTEIFWLVLSSMRTRLKVITYLFVCSISPDVKCQKEIKVLLHEIFFPILEMRTFTLKQKVTVLAMLSKSCQEPQALVELYLNYDCDGDSIDSVYKQ